MDRTLGRILSSWSDMLMSLRRWRIHNSKNIGHYPFKEHLFYQTSWIKLSWLNCQVSKSNFPKFALVTVIIHQIGTLEFNFQSTFNFRNSNFQHGYELRISDLKKEKQQIWADGFRKWQIRPDSRNPLYSERSMVETPARSCFRHL